MSTVSKKLKKYLKENEYYIWVVHIHKIPLSRKKRWNTAIGDNMDGSWEYHVESDGKSQEPYDFTHMWNIKLTATN